MIEILALSAFVYGKFRFVLFGMWWFLITLLQVSNVVEIYILIAQRFCIFRGSDFGLRLSHCKI